VLVRAAAVRADEARGVGVVDEDEGVVAVGQVADPVDLGVMPSMEKKPVG